jgi:hypothetical protein
MIFTFLGGQSPDDFLVNPFTTQNRTMQLARLAVITWHYSEKLTF